MSSTRHALIVLTLCLSLAPTVFGITYYVAPDSSFTVDQAIDAVASGDIIYMRGGTYILDHSINIPVAAAAMVWASSWGRTPARLRSTRSSPGTTKPSASTRTATAIPVAVSSTTPPSSTTVNNA